MKTNLRAISALVSILFLGTFGIGFAADYHLAAPLPGGGETATDFTQYMTYLFPFLLSVAAILALVMFVVGAIQYMLAGDGSTQPAKDRMMNALAGLLLAVFSVVILQTINPELIKLALNLTPVGGGKDAAYARQGCTDQNQCPSGICEDAASGNGKCLITNQPAGSACINQFECAVTTICAPSSSSAKKKCQPVAANGESCDPVSANCELGTACLAVGENMSGFTCQGS